MATITLGTYLFKRLQQFGIESIFGVPGDFNLALLDHIDEVENVSWVGNTNELNAGYAADGYGRTKGIAALVTTFGVGELSALAAVAGSYSEHVGVVHVVGIPNKISRQKKELLHHTLGNGDFNVFSNMSQSISAGLVILDDGYSAPDDIDRLLRTCWIAAQPVYIGFPTNLVDFEVPASRLDTPIDLSLPPNDPDVENEVLETILKMMKESKNASILVDACATRHRVVDEVHKLAHKTQFPIFVTPMGKGAINEQDPRFGGVYVGELSKPEVKKAAEATDLVISVGAILSDFNTGSFSYGIDRSKFIELHSNWCKIRHATFPGIQMKPLLDKLLSRIEQASTQPSPNIVEVKLPEVTDAPASHEYLWPRLGHFLRSGDTVITETGTSSFGINSTRFPSGVSAVTQVLWGSIGYSVGSCLGVSLARKEMNPGDRVILFVGDGSVQLTVTEISSMIRRNVKPIIFILNNDGYTIERLIHGPNASYNDIQMWKYTEILNVFNAQQYRTYKISTIKELDSLFNNPEFASADVIQLVELILPKFDAPAALKKQAELTASINMSNK